MKTDIKKESEPRISGSDSVPILREGIGTRIDALVSDVGGMKNAVHICGRGDDAIRRWSKNEGSGAPFAALASLAEKAGASLDWLATGEGPKYRAESGAGSGEEPATSGEQGNSGSQDADRKARMCEQAEAATIPSVDLFWDMAAVTKALVRMFTRDQILDLDAADLSDRIQLAYHLVKCTSSRPENSQKE